MKFSRLIFPAPNPPSYSQDRLVGELLYVPKDFSNCPFKYIEKSRKPPVTSKPYQSQRRSTLLTKSNSIGGDNILREISNASSRDTDNFKKTLSAAQPSRNIKANAASLTSYQTTQSSYAKHRDSSRQALAQKNYLTATSSHKAMPQTPRQPAAKKFTFGEVSRRDNDYVPCLFLPCIRYQSKKLLIVFHGNAEDLGTTYSLCDHLRTALAINVLGVEYPGYGVYKDDEGPSEEKILRDAELVYNFVQDVAQLEQKDIMVLGRSLGSGPATHLAAKYEPASLLLLSPYTSIKSVASSKVGTILSSLLAQQFDNLQKMHRVTCPTFIVHGQRDTLIPIEHAFQLRDRCFGPCTFVSPAFMTHNRFDVYEDLVNPISHFLAANNILDDDEESEDEGLREQSPNLLNSAASLNDSFLQSIHKVARQNPKSKLKQLYATQLIGRSHKGNLQLTFDEQFFIPPRQKALANKPTEKKQTGKVQMMTQCTTKKFVVAPKTKLKANAPSMEFKQTQLKQVTLQSPRDLNLSMSQVKLSKRTPSTRLLTQTTNPALASGNFDTTQKKQLTLNRISKTRRLNASAVDIYFPNKYSAALECNQGAQKTQQSKDQQKSQKPPKVKALKRGASSSLEESKQHTASLVSQYQANR